TGITRQEIELLDEHELKEWLERPIGWLEDHVKSYDESHLQPLERWARPIFDTVNEAYAVMSSRMDEKDHEWLQTILGMREPDSLYNYAFTSLSMIWLWRGLVTHGHMQAAFHIAHKIGRVEREVEIKFKWDKPAVFGKEWLDNLKEGRDHINQLRKEKAAV